MDVEIFEILEEAYLFHLIMRDSNFGSQLMNKKEENEKKTKTRMVININVTLEYQTGGRPSKEEIEKVK